MSTTTRRTGKPTLNLTHPELAAQIHPDSLVRAHEVTAGSSKKKPLWVCEEGHTWEAAVTHRVNGNGCRACHLAKLPPKNKTLSHTHPELAAQIHPDSLVKAHEVTAGSSKKPLWVCEEGHTWYARVTHRVSGSACRICCHAPKNKTLNLTHPEFAAQIHPDSPIQAHEVTAGSHKKPLWVCEEGHTWYARVAGRVNGSGCRACQGVKPHPNKKTLNLTHPELAKQIHPDSPVQAHEVTAGSNKKPLWVCEEGHTWEAMVVNRVNGRGCKKCYLTPSHRTLNLTHPELAKQIHPDSPVQAHEATAGSHKKPLWVCEEGHTWLMAVQDRVRGSGCPKCRDFTPIVKSLAATHSHLVAQIHPDSPVQAHEATAGSHKKPLWVCEEGHTWFAAVQDRVRGSGCPHCGSSQGERDVRDHLTTLLPAGMSVIANTRKIIHPLELDMYVPELKLAVEYNGTYWHSNEVILAKCGITADEYHNNKKRRCEEQGITLLFVEEHDWKTRPQHVKQCLQDAVSTALMGTKTLV